MHADTVKFQVIKCRRDYVEINSALVPLRWMAWESIVEVFLFYINYNFTFTFFQGIHIKQSGIYSVPPLISTVTFQSLTFTFSGSIYNKVRCVGIWGDPPDSHFHFSKFDFHFSRVDIQQSQMCGHSGWPFGRFLTLLEFDLMRNWQRQRYVIGNLKPIFKTIVLLQSIWKLEDEFGRRDSLTTFWNIKQIKKNSNHRWKKEMFKNTKVIS